MKKLLLFMLLLPMLAGAQIVKPGKVTGGSSGTAASVSVINNLNQTTTGSALDAAQGKVLKGLVDLKQDATAGKGLSTNDYTTAEKTKLAGIASGATNVTDNAQLANGAGYQSAGQVTAAVTSGLASATAITTATITTGGSYTFAAGVNRININPSTTISSLTITLPNTTTDGRIVKINVGGTMTSGTIVTSMSINQTGGSVPIQSNTPTSASYGQVFIYTYDGTIASPSFRRDM